LEKRVLAKYASPEGAASYNVKYEREFHKRISHRVELKLLRRLFAFIGPRERLLDLPSGAGRMFSEIGKAARRFVECDYSREMLKLCRQNIAGAGVPAHFVTASCFHMPYRDGVFDCVFSARLMHHIPDRDERFRFIAEMARVSSAWVVTTYFDTRSVKNLLRRIRSIFNKKRPKVTFTTAEMRQIGAQFGLDLIASWPLSRLFSGHRYAIFRKRGESAAKGNRR
jgi:ubiquinone/menaquinone biosynthesis C-methylase UbiE